MLLQWHPFFVPFGRTQISRSLSFIKSLHIFVSSFSFDKRNTQFFFSYFFFFSFSLLISYRARPSSKLFPSSSLLIFPLIEQEPLPLFLFLYILLFSLKLSLYIWKPRNFSPRSSLSWLRKTQISFLLFLFRISWNIVEIYKTQAVLPFLNFREIPIFFCVYWKNNRDI